MDKDSAAPGGRRWVLVVSFFATVAAVYLLSGHGRIDSIDGQVRFDATATLVRSGELVLSDRNMQIFGSLGRDGRRYSPYGPAPSVVAAPLVAMGGLGGDPQGERRRFLFTWTGPLVGAALATVLLLFYRALGLTDRAAVGWALAAAFGTYLWPAAETVLEQGQHAFWALLAVYLGFLGARRGSIALVVAGGAAAGILVLYQPPYLLHLPLLALVVLSGPGERSSARGRYVLFLAAGLVGAAALVALNLQTFGEPLNPGSKSYDHPGLLGNPAMGIAGLLVSPGKGLLFYCPAILLGVAGWPGLKRREPRLAAVVVGVALLHLLFIGSLSIWHSDWCWGPRYLTLLVPLACLAFPFASLGRTLPAGRAGGALGRWHRGQLPGSRHGARALLLRARARDVLLGTRSGNLLADLADPRPGRRDPGHPH